MKIARRSLLVIVAALIATVGLTLLWITLPPASALSASPPMPMPEPLAPTVEFSATLRLTPDRAHVEVGQVLILTVELDVVEGCGYPIMDLTVVEAGNNTPLFAHIDPSKDTIFPDVFPSVWSFRALRPGTATFSAETFGEGNCDGTWFWHYENAQTDQITVLDTVGRPYHTWIPTAYAPAGEDR